VVSAEEAAVSAEEAVSEEAVEEADLEEEAEAAVSAEEAEVDLAAEVVSAGAEVPFSSRKDRT